jgi:glutamate synthase domain-containing protein 3
LAAGKSGGSAFVLDEVGDFPRRCNLEMVDPEPLREPEDHVLVRDLLSQHAGYTASTVAMRLLTDWDWAVTKFVKVMPVDYRHVLSELKCQAADVAQWHGESAPRGEQEGHDERLWMCLAG